MKVLIIHQHFKVPHHGGAIRSYYLARALVKKKIEVVVITAHNDPGYKKAVFEGIQVHYLPVAYENRFGFLKRVFAFWRFAVRSARFAVRHRDADVCYAISTPLTTGVAALMIRRWYRMPYIFEVGDLWPDAPIEMGYIRNPLFGNLLFQLETRIYKGAEAIVALSPAIANAIEKKIKGKTIHVLPNMADTDFFKPEGKRAELVDKFGVRQKFVISYIGAIGVANGLHFLLDCAAACANKGFPVHFLVCGDGAMTGSLKDYARNLKLSNLSFIPFQNRDGVAEIMNVTDANFISYQPVKILETGSPNKYFDGLAAGKLTIINFGGWIRDEIEKESCGIFVDQKSPEDFPFRIEPFLNDPQHLNKYQQAGRTLAERKYSRTDLGEKFLNILCDARHGQPAAPR